MSSITVSVTSFQLATSPKRGVDPRMAASLSLRLLCRYAFCYACEHTWEEQA